MIAESALTRSPEREDLADLRRVFEAVDDMPIGFSDRHTNGRIMAKIKSVNYPRTSIQRRDGGLVCWDFDSKLEHPIQTAEEKEFYARLLRTQVDYGYTEEWAQSYLEFIDDPEFQELYDAAEPYKLNYKVLGFEFPYVNLPGSKDYIDKFKEAGNEHLAPPAVVLESANIEGMESAQVLHEVGDVYFRQMSSERQHQTEERLARLKSNDAEELIEVPSAVICIPIAAIGETEEILQRTIDALSGQEFQGDVEVVLYANYPESQLAENKSKLDDLKAFFERNQRIQLDSEGSLKIRFAVEGYNELSISKVRKDMTDIVAKDLINRGASYETPVLWMDADTTRLSKDFIQQHIDAHPEDDPYDLSLISSNIRFDMSDAQSTQEDPVPQKLAAYAELERRRIQRLSSPAEEVDSVYIEESGLSFSVGTYLFIGGVNSVDPINESARMRDSASVYAYRHRRIFGSDVQALNHSKIRSAKLSSSGRRQIEGAAGKLRDRTRSMDHNLFFTHTGDAFVSTDNSARLGEAAQLKPDEYGDFDVRLAIEGVDRYSAYEPHIPSDEELDRLRERGKQLIDLSEYVQ